MPERTIIVDGFSKSYAMTGWRLGYAIMPDALAAKVSFAHSRGRLHSGLYAEGGHCRSPRMRRRRRQSCAAIPKAQRCLCRRPQRYRRRLLPPARGAFYTFPNVSALGIPSITLADRLLNEAGVACLSGTDFGPNGEGYLRFTYAASQAELDEAVRRVGEFVAKL